MRFATVLICIFFFVFGVAAGKAAIRPKNPFAFLGKPDSAYANSIKGIHYHCLVWYEKNGFVQLCVIQKRVKPKPKPGMGA